jgi:hypothetical protein
MLDLTRLRDEVARDNEVNASAATLILRLAAEVEANKNDPEALQAFVDQLRSQNDTLAKSVAENTPHDPEPPTPPTEPPAQPPAEPPTV